MGVSQIPCLVKADVPFLQSPFWVLRTSIGYGIKYPVQHTFLWTQKYIHMNLHHAGNVVLKLYAQTLSILEQPTVCEVFCTRIAARSCI